MGLGSTALLVTSIENVLNVRFFGKKLTKTTASHQFLIFYEKVIVDVSEIEFRGSFKNYDILPFKRTVFLRY